MADRRTSITPSRMTFALDDERTAGGYSPQRSRSASLMDASLTSSKSWASRFRLSLGELARNLEHSSLLSSPRLNAILSALLPTFLNRRLRRNANTKNEPLHAVASLDGLRGLACLFVFNEHLTYNYTHSFLYGWGVEDRRTLAQFPFVRIFWSGFSMVAVFYVISGYVLSYKPLKQIRSRNQSGFYQTMTSSIFRRALRLFIPSMIATILCGVLVSLGAFRKARFIFAHDTSFHLHEGVPPDYEGFFVQLLDAAHNALKLLNIWNWSNDSPVGDYDLHLWTIPTEFRSSMVLFLILVGVSRLRRLLRLATTVGFIIFCILTDRRDVILFVFGMLLADIDLERNENKSLQSRQPLDDKAERRRRSLWLLCFVVGIYLATAPTIGCEATPGFAFLATLTPSTYGNAGFFLQSCGAILLTWSAANCEDVKPIFTNAPVQYLGRISYALYLVHGNILKSLLYAMMPSIRQLVGGNETMTHFVMTWIVGAILIVPVALWAADLFERGVDIPCVTFAKWVEASTTEPWDGERAVHVR